MQVELDGAAVVFADYGRGLDPARPTVVFVHGAGMDHSVWPLQARHFAYRGWNALAVDLPGHGKSGGELRKSIPAMADWLWDFLKKLQVGGVAVVGHSMGALIALELAAGHRKKIESIALLGVAPRMPVHPDLLEAAGKRKGAAPKLMCDWGFGPHGHFGGHQAPGSWMMGHGLALLAASAGPRLKTDLAACNAYQGGLEAAAKLKCPTLIVAGSNDRMTPARQAARLADAITNARLTTIPDCGHMMIVEQPDATLDALVGFLGDAALGR